MVIAYLALLMLAVSLTWHLLIAFHVHSRRHRPREWKRQPINPGSRGLPKPEWVRKEVLRLKALMSKHGCRALAAVFNQLHRARGMSVGKTYVATLIQRHQLEVLRQRRKIKHRVPWPIANNKVWAVDLTFVRSGEQPELVLGILDHGTRAYLVLRALSTKASVHLLRELLDAIERYGRPQALRTDNEMVFTSMIFRFALRLLGIRHQRTQRCAPWQNGRIERFFGTFKERWRARTILPGLPELQGELDAFRFWYNHARPHQHLDGLTPATGWSGKIRPTAKPRFVSAWKGVLRGYFVPT